MTDELEQMKAQLRAEEPVRPREGARRTAIAQAMSAFDEENAHAAQGNRFTDRLMDTATAAFETIIGRRPMKLSPAFAGGASLSVLLIAALSATYIQSDDPKLTIGTPVMPRMTTPAAERKQAAQQNAPAKSPEAKKPDAEKFMADRSQSSEERLSVLQMPPPAEPSAVAVQQQRMIATKKYKAPLSRDASGDIASPMTQAPANSPSRGRAHTRALNKQYSLNGRVSQDWIVPPQFEPQGRDKFENTTSNPVKLTREEPVSTFSVDVDTASYSFMRASLNNNTLPQKDAVRVEELINYFPYDYARPSDKSAPFKANISVFPSPWNKDRKLVHIGIAGFELKTQEKPHANLVFLLDTSGSMNQPDKLPLLINSFKLLLGTLKPDDTVSIVTYAGNAGTALEPTQVKEKTKILAALDNLHTRGSTAGAEGIRQAYELAQHSYDKKGINRVILATDGDFNVGINNPDELKSYIERQREKGITLSVLGFGRGNYNDALMQTLAQNGNGNASYIDTLNEARKVLVEEAGSTLFTIAKDVKLQMEFNPRKVAEYRLIGYETRLLKREDFNNDKVDAGDIGAGHRVTAIYEIAPAGSTALTVDALRYQTAKPLPTGANQGNEYGFLKIRYKLPGGKTSRLITTPVDAALESPSLAAAPREARFASSVAAFGQILRGGRYTGSFSYDDVIALALGARGNDAFGYRSEFINLVRLAKTANALQPLRR